MDPAETGTILDPVVEEGAAAGFGRSPCVSGVKIFTMPLDMPPEDGLLPIIVGLTIDLDDVLALGFLCIKPSCLQI